MSVFNAALVQYPNYRQSAEGLETMRTDDIGWIEVFVAAVTLIVAVAALIVSRRTQSTEKQAFLAAMRAEWHQLQPSWHQTLMYINGPDDYYHATPLRQRRKFERLLRKFDRTAQANWSSADDAWWRWIRTERETVRKTVRFLVFASENLISQRWTVQDAYLLLGPDVARHYKSVLWLAGMQPDLGDFVGRENLEQWNDQLREINFYSERDSLAVLAVLMRAEQCVRSDTYAHFVTELASALRRDGWLGDMRAVLSRAGRARRKLVLWRLRWLLHKAAHPRKRSGFLYESQSITTDEVKYYRRFYESEKGATRRIIKLGGVVQGWN